MNKNESYNGFWWFPDDPANKFAGELKITISGSLTLLAIEYDSVSRDLRNRILNTRIIPLIHGYAKNSITKNDLSFSLFTNQVSSYSISGLAEFSIHCKFATTYKHYITPDSLRISSAFLELQSLNEWINITGTRDIKFRSKKKFNFTIYYDQPKPITLFKSKELHLYLWHYALLNSPQPGFVLTESPRVNIEFNKALSFEKLNSYIELIQNLLSFCVSLPVSIKNIEYQEYSKLEFKKLKVNINTLMK